MKRIKAVLLAASLAVAGGCSTKTTVNTAGETTQGTQYVQTASGGRLPAGTKIWVTTTQLINDQNHVGDPVTARVSQPIYSQDGQTLIPEGARVMGHVTELHNGKGREAPSVGVAFDSVTLAGQNVTFHGPVVSSDVPGDGKGPFSNVKGSDVLIGGAAGMILGGVTGGGKGALIGTAAGAAAGTLISMGVRDKKPELPRGTSLAVQTQSTMPSLASIERSKKKTY